MIPLVIPISQKLILNSIINGEIMKKTVLLTGGAGYIGSHTAYLLHTLGYQVIILDSLLHNQSFMHPWAQLIKADVADVGILASIFKTNQIHAVMHFAGFIEVGESVKRPADFYRNNVTNSLILLDVMREHGIKNFIFSSTCAVYGNPVHIPMAEDHPFAPVSPYAKTKLVVEYALQDYAQAYDLRYVALRYFNAAGVQPEQNLGECHEPETHVIPLLLRSIKNNKPFTIFGSDYNTPDGTCIRDYVHVCDIAQAHVQALEYLDAGNSSDVFNLGTGTGYSVRQLVDVASKVCGKNPELIVQSARAGDSSVLVANAQKARKILNWVPEHSGLENIITTAWRWEQRNKNKEVLHEDSMCIGF